MNFLWFGSKSTSQNTILQSRRKKCWEDVGWMRRDCIFVPWRRHCILLVSSSKGSCVRIFSCAIIISLPCLFFFWVRIFYLDIIDEHTLYSAVMEKNSFMRKVGSLQQPAEFEVGHAHHHVSIKIVYIMQK